MDVRQLMEYDGWATGKLLEAVQGLSPEQFVFEFADSCSSVRQQFVHLLLTADRYRARLAHEEVPDVSFEVIETPLDLVAYEAGVRRRLGEFVNRLGEDELKRFEEHGTRKGVFRASVEGTLGHMVNHATYHRGQVACLLKMHGVEFADTDFIIWQNRVES